MAYSFHYKRQLRKENCAYCGEDTKITIDHIHPTKHGGINHWSNFTSACCKCNGEKASLSLLGYLLYRSDPHLSFRKAEMIGGFSSPIESGDLATILNYDVKIV